MGNLKNQNSLDILRAKKIRQARERAGLSAADLADKIGVSRNTVYGYESGISDPKSDGLAAIARACGCSVDFLLGLADIPGPAVVPVSISDEAIAAARDYDSLPDHARGAVRALLDYEISTAPPVAMIDLQIFRVPASAGLGNYLDESAYVIESVPAADVPAHTDYGVVISGDSMEPDIPDGSVVYVQQSPVVESGDIGLFHLGGQVYCKRLQIDRQAGEVRLQSINPAYEDIVLTRSDTLFTLGKVLGVRT